MMGTIRRQAKWTLALAACVVGFAAAGVVRATTYELFVEGAWNYAISGESVVLSVDKVRNLTVPARITGELTLELWAFRLTYTGLLQADYQQNGYRLASYAIGRLAPGYYLVDVNSGPIPFHPPPPGVWNITSLIVEYDASAINFGGLLPRAFFNYAPPKSPLTILAPLAGAVPQSGLWWDPAQIGNAYSITVKNGTAVVVVNAFQPDGSPVWYLSAGPLSANGQTYTGTLDRYVGGPCIPCVDPRFPTGIGNDGSITINFQSSTSATVFLPGGRVAHIVPASF